MSDKLAIRPNGDGTHTFACNGCEFQVFEPGSLDQHETPRTDAAALVDSVTNAVAQTVTVWQNLMLACGLPVDPWVDEAAKPIVMGIVQNEWYEHFKGAVPESVARRQADRVREFPTLVATIAERRKQAAERAEQTKAKKAGVSEEERLAKKAERDAKKAATVAERAEKKSAREAERAALKLLKDAEKAIKAPRAPRTSNGTRNTANAHRVVTFADGALDKTKEFKGQKSIVVAAFVELGRGTVAQLAERCVFEGSKQSAASVVNYYVSQWLKDGLLVECAQPSELASAPVEIEEIEETTPQTGTKKSNKKSKKGKK
jgi:hypothetical protein